MLEQEPGSAEVGSVRDDHAHFQHRLDACDTALRRLTKLTPVPLDAVESLLDARQVAEQRLSNVLPENAVRLVGMSDPVPTWQLACGHEIPLLERAARRSAPTTADEPGLREAPEPLGT